MRECLAEVLATFVMMVSRARRWVGAGGCRVCVTGLMVLWWQVPGVPRLCCRPLGAGKVWGCATLTCATRHCLSSPLDPVPTAWSTLCHGSSAIRVWCWVVCALIPPASEQAKVGALVLFLAFGLHPMMANVVPGAMLWYLFPNSSPQKAVYLIAYNLVTLPSKPQVRAVTTSLPVSVWCPSMGEQNQGCSTSTALALLPCSISGGRVSARGYQG